MIDNNTILVVDDHAAMRNFLQRVLTARGYTVLLANNGVEALEIAATSDQIDVVLTDVMMPEMNGIDLAANIKRDHPGMKVILMSGYMCPSMTQDLFFDKDLMLKKPFTADDLDSVLKMVLTGN